MRLFASMNAAVNHVGGRVGGDDDLMANSDDQKHTHTTADALAVNWPHMSR